MAKVGVEICLISARGLRRSSSLWKLQWFAVGWIDPKSKYCTKIDTSGSSNPTWRTKFSASIDDSESNWQGLALHVQVYSRDAIFLREKLHGTAVVALKEFLGKYKSEAGLEQVGSFQLRKKKSGTALGFIDVSVRISEEEEELRDHREISSYPIGNGEGFELTEEGNGTSFGMGNRPPYSSEPHLVPADKREFYPPPPQMTSPYDPRPLSYPANYYANPLPPPPVGGGPTYRPPRTPPPPPPPSHVGYLPTLLPGTGQLQGTFLNIPTSSSAGHGGAPNFGMGMGAGALAAGAVIFGDDFMSGFQLPSSSSSSSLPDDTLVISTDSPF